MILLFICGKIPSGLGFFIGCKQLIAYGFTYNWWESWRWEAHMRDTEKSSKDTGISPPSYSYVWHRYASELDVIQTYLTSPWFFFNVWFSGSFCNHYFLQMLATLSRGYHDMAYVVGECSVFILYNDFWDHFCQHFVLSRSLVAIFPNTKCLSYVWLHIPI